MNIDVGQVIAGKYELVKLLGKGAMGEVWLANHNSLGGQFAIKLVEPTDDIEAETAAGRFQLEAQIAAKLSRRTRHIVSVSDHGEENGLAYLVMELLEGESLEARTKRTGALTLPEVAAIVSQVARALSLAHEEGIFHRDLKPANVWLGRDEDGRLLAKLLDFGIARSAKPFRTRTPFATSKDMVLGTPSYMSPEQARGLETLDHRCDLWALAVVAYEALTTRIPFEGETVEDIFLSICTFRVVPALARRADLPPAIEAFFARAFAPTLEERFASAAELTEAFERLVTPEDLELALGIPPTPTSARRLEVARGSSPGVGSHPDLGGHAARPGSRPDLGSSPGRLGSHPDLGSSPGRLGSHPDLGSHPNVGSTSDPQMVARGSSPDFENVALGEPTYNGRRNGTTGWLIAVAGLIALLGIGILVLVAFRGPSRTVGAQPTEVATTAATTPPPVAASESAAPLDAPSPVGVDLPEPPSTSKAAPIAARPKTTAAKTADVTPPPPATPAAPPPTTPPAPAPTPAKTVNKAEVF
ncbi:MAG: serine/threonine protein kinase [Labilithrix sp.]|nr:serine/threonine protein kinase [Labilithrix sp.]